MDRPGINGRGGNRKSDLKQKSFCALRAKVIADHIVIFSDHPMGIIREL